MSCLATIRTISLILTILGAINWGLIGAIEFNLVHYVLGEGHFFSRLVYLLIGAAGILLAIDTFGCKSSCIQTNL